MAKGTCSVPICDRPAFCRTWCGAHYARWRNGDLRPDVPIGMTPMAWPHSLLDRREPQPGGCVFYMGQRDANDYGILKRDHREVKAHRAAYELWVGPIPEGWHVHHLCHAPPCVEPSHLLALSPDDHYALHGRLSARAQQTHCKRGHPFDEANTYWNPADGCRNCKACQKQWRQAHPKPRAFHPGRVCAACGGPIDPHKRADAVLCVKNCKGATP